MSSKDFSRQYFMLRPIGCQATGFVRLEVHHGQGRIAIHANHLPEGRSLRALLISGHSKPGCVLDLGPVQTLSDHSAAMQPSAIPSPALRGYDALLLVTDWPEPVPVLFCFLTRPPRCLLERLLKVLEQYMALPCPDTPLASPATLPDAPQESPPVSPLMAQLEKSPSQLPEDSLLRLYPLRWPKSCSRLRAYFDSLPPCAPFDAPGWRFVRIPLEDAYPYGVIGVHSRSHCVDRTAYALPGAYGSQPPEDGYAWHKGRDGQGYWLRIQDCSITQ